jgi:hypothetical protein
VLFEDLKYAVCAYWHRRLAVDTEDEPIEPAKPIGLDKLLRAEEGDVNAIVIHLNLWPTHVEVGAYPMDDWAVTGFSGDANLLTATLPQPVGEAIVF